MLIYRVRNLINNKVYIGLHRGDDPEIRWRSHVNAANNFSSYKQYFHRAIKKYGQENFQVVVLMSCSDYDDLKEFERLYIRHYRSNNKIFGYNLTTGGEGTIGKVYTLEERKAISDRMKGNTHATGNKNVLGKTWKSATNSTRCSRSVWVHDTEHERFITQDSVAQALADGWKPGRLPGQKRASWNMNHKRKVPTYSPFPLTYIRGGKTNDTLPDGQDKSGRLFIARFAPRARAQCQLTYDHDSLELKPNNVR